MLYKPKELDFQLYRALCKRYGHTGPLHRCYYYGDRVPGKRFNDMTAMGPSRLWLDVLDAITGQRQIDASMWCARFRSRRNFLALVN